MSLALTVLAWTLAVSVALTTIMGISFIGEATRLLKMKAHNEGRLYGPPRT